MWSILKAYVEHIKRFSFVPKAFTGKNKIQEITGIYVPVWLFDTHVDGTVHYTGDKVKVFSKRREIYTYDIHRQGNMDFSNLPVNASVNLGNELLESIANFDYKDLKPFSTAYLAGYCAERYDIKVDKAKKRAEERFVNTAAMSMIKNNEEIYQNVDIKECNFKFTDTKYLYTLLHVWLISTKWEDNIYTFAINGQTGVVAGELPYSSKEYWKYIGRGMIVIFIIWMILAYIIL